MDNNYSAAIVPGTSNKYWTCFACGARGDIFKAVEYREGIHGFYEKLKFISSKYKSPLKFEKVQNEVEQVYYYKDPEGKLLYKIIRKDRITNGIKEKYFLPASYENGSWVKGLKNTKRVLYNLPEMLRAIKDGQTLYFVEGELCLRLNYTVFYDRFIKYCKDYNISHDILSLNSFKKQLRKMDYCLYYNKPGTFRKSRYVDKEFKTSRAAVLSLDKLKTRNLEIDFLIG